MKVIIINLEISNLKCLFISLHYANSSVTRIVCDIEIFVHFHIANSFDVEKCYAQNYIY